MSDVAADPLLLEQAVELTRRAGELTLKWYRSDELTIDSKGDGTPVTQADRAAERLLREEIEKLYPDDGIFGEEEAEKIGTSGRRWILDPIDGTKAFTHGVPLYSNLVAVEDEHGIAIGVINIPALGETVYAGRGLGCFCNGQPTRVNNRSTLRGSYVTTSGMNRWPTKTLANLQENDVHLRTWGDGYGYVLVATGRIEAMVDNVAELYDLAPVPVIIAEAGGRFTDLNTGTTSSPGAGSGMASNGILHDELRALLAP